MKTWITIVGIECAVCSEGVEAEILATHTVENVFNSLHTKILFIHLKNCIIKEAFLNSISRYPQNVKPSYNEVCYFIGEGTMCISLMDGP